MSRVEQPAGSRGSLKWIQRAVNLHPQVLNEPLLAQIPGAAAIEWLSPLAGDNYAEYRDGDFLDRIGAGVLRAQLAQFWPQRGPQWDALARTDRGDVLLIEAKAYIAEMMPKHGCAAESPASIASIKSSLDATAAALGAEPRAPWFTTFFQFANRLAHLRFLREHGVAAWLVLINFVGDDDMDGPHTAEEWEAAYRVVGYVMGLPARHALARHVIHLHPHISTIA
jgi:hypothetical protein